MKYTMYCENKHRIAFVDANTSEQNTTTSVTSALNF